MTAPPSSPSAARPADPAPGTPAARRRAARALGDAALAAALATRDEAAWAEFDARFRPLLTAYARRVGIPTALWPRCVDDVLADEALRLADGAPPPAHLAAYLVRSAYHAMLKARRADARRAARYAAAAAGDVAAGARPDPDGVVAALCSAAARRASAGAHPGDGGPRGWDGAGEDGDQSGAAAVLAGIVAAVTAELTDAERQLLIWVAEQVPRRQIAAWLGDGYEATRKRIQRLAGRLRAAVLRHAATLPAPERHELARFLRRAGQAAPVPPPTPRPGAARAAGPGAPPGRAAPPDEDAP